MEAYPELKSNESAMHLQRSINEWNEQIAAAQRNYNAMVLQYNNSIAVFPNNILASIFGFRRQNYLDIIEEERENPNIKKLFS